MRQDEMIKLAREAGFDDDNQFTIYNIERFAALVAAHEREACAKLVETTHAEGLQSIREACAAAIRARNMPND